MADPVELVEQLKQMVHEMEKALRSLRRDEIVGHGKPSLERVIAALEQAKGRPLTANEIAEAARLLPGTVRMVLYSNRNRFLEQRTSPRRVKWSLAPVRSTEFVMAD